MAQRSFPSQILTALVASAALSGCALDKKDDADEFREAVPRREAVRVAGPERDAEGDASAAAIDGRAGAQATAPLRGGPYSKWYGFTRVVRGGVNAVTAAVLGSVWVLVHTEPDSVEGGEAVWGPYGDALNPATYRLRVTRVADAEYDYVLEGRPRSSSPGAAYRAVLTGHGYGRRHELHGEGEFTIDLDVARELDPFAHPNDSGTVRIVHHLPRGWRDGTFLPRSIVAEVTPDPELNPESFAVTSNANEDGTGSLYVTAEADVDETKTSALEDIVIESRWRADGAGRADIGISGGDVPADPGRVSAVECWGADFTRSYYSDSLELEPTEGEDSACVYGAP